jgi:lysophospholipase L1-like esterase
MLKAILIITVVFLLFMGVSLLRLRNQVVRYKSYWESQTETPAEPNAVTYIALGDSTAQGIGASKPENGYVGLLASEITASTHRPVHIINISKSGAKIADVINEQLPQLASLKTGKAVITMEIGANDMVANADEDAIRAGAEQLFSQLPKNVIVSDIPSFSKTWLSSREIKIAQSNKIYREVARKHGFELVPLYDRLKSTHGWSGNAIDFFHPNDKGYEVWAEVFKDKVLKAVVY